MILSYHGYVFETNVASLPLDVDAADGTFEALLADIAEVMSISTHPDGRTQVLFARPTLKYGKQSQPLGYLVDGLSIIFCHLSRVVDTDSDSSLIQFHNIIFRRRSRKDIAIGHHR